jgi:RHS repeat-associated protein
VSRSSRFAVVHARRRPLFVVAALVVLGALGGLVPVLSVAAGGSDDRLALRAVGASTGAVTLKVPGAAHGGRAFATVAAHEIESLRTARSRTYVLADGRRLARVFAQPVNYRDRRGDWRPIDDRLVPAATGRLGNAANRFDVGLPASLGDGPVRLTHGSASVSFALAGARGAGTVSGATERFDEALPDTTVAYESVDSGLKETLTLHGAHAPREFHFRVKPGDGLRARARHGGHVDIVDGDGDVRFTLAAPVMWDADKAAPTSHRVSASAQANDDGSLDLVYKPDRDFVDATLGAGHRVAIDPTVTVGPAPDCTLDSGAPSTSDCTSSLLTVGAASGRDHHALLNFDIKSVVPKDVEIEEGWLETTLASTLNGTAEDVGIYNVTRSWTSSATWNTYDGTHGWTTAGGDVPASPELSQTIDPCCLDTYFWSITPLAKKWISGAQPQNGVLLKQTSGSATNEFRFNSNESTATKPVFNVFYMPRTGSVKGLQQDTQQLSDRSSVSVELSGGNLLYTANDLHIAGTAGEDLALTRVYNSREVVGEHMSFGWRLEPTDTELVVGGGQAGGAGAIDWIGPDGARRTFFRKVGNATDYTSPMGIDATLTAVAGTNYHNFELVFNQSKEKWKYSGCGNGCDLHLDSIEDRTGANKVSFIYDATDTEKLTGATDTQGRTVTPSYDANNHMTGLTVKDSAGNTLRTYGYGYDANGKLTSYTDPDSKVTQYAYEPNGNLNQITSPEGRVTKITYVNPSSGDDRVKDITRVDNPAAGTGPKTSYCYQSPSASGTACAAFDSSRCPTAAGNEATPTIGGTEVTDPLGHVTKYCWDSEGRITKTIDANGNTSTSGYSPNNDVASGSIGNGSEAASSSNTWEAANPGDLPNRLKSGTLGQLGTETRTGAFSFTYDTADSLPFQTKTATDTAGSTFTYAYNSQGKLSSVTDSLTPNNTAKLEWNGETATPSCPVQTSPAPKTGTLRCAIDGNGNQRVYTYDADGNLTKITPPTTTPLLGATTIVPDKFSRPSTITDGKGRTRTITYDGEDRVTSITWATGNSVTYSYDGDGNLTSQVDSIAGTSSYTFDKLNRMTHQGLPGSRTTDYTYDDASNLKTVADAGGTVTYSYDAANRLSGIADPTGTCTAPASKCTTYGYDSRNNATSITFPNSVAITQGFDGSDDVTQIKAQKGTASPIVDLTYTYGDVGTTGRSDLRQSVLDAVANHKTTYTYDAQDRLTEAQKLVNGTSTQVSDYQYKYDGANNRTRQIADTGSGPTTTYYGYNAVNELCWLKVSTTDPGSGCTAPTGATLIANSSPAGFDADGNQTTDSAGTTGKFAYNIRNQMSSLAGSTLGYNGADNSELLSAGTVTYNDSMLGVSSRTGSTTGTAYFTRDPNGTLVTDRDPAGSYYYIHDALGSVIALTDSTGAVAKSYSYDPYGKTTTGAGSLAQYFRYAEGLLPTATAPVTKFGQRYYDAEAGRWTQPDPVEQPGSLREGNLYLYAGADPINLVDPSGQCSVVGCIAAGVGGGLVLGASAFGTWACYDATGEPHCYEILTHGVAAAGTLTGAAIVGGKVRRPSCSGCYPIPPYRPSAHRNPIG